ncbi:Hypothetical protein LOCK900_0544 [Lacticaseibacillus rhamnosus LOCK900]|nr:Hypothetical protein LOCK900_0544 [Lacticaseibacillus rhamnosus LOCK900]EHJ28478.1 hypothetical protein HMPREF0541_02149 [Lacticaseibacillus rhamnosus ATCC 21052]
MNALKISAVETNTDQLCKLANHVSFYQKPCQKMRSFRRTAHVKTKKPSLAQT